MPRPQQQTSKKRLEKTKSKNLFSATRIFFAKLHSYYTLADTDAVLRRYFALNSFDGVLTTLGILLSGFFFRIESSAVIVTACIGAAVALAVSGVWGAYFAEGAERRRKLIELEKAVLHKLENTDVARAEKFATILIAGVNGATPLIAALLTISPFLFFSATAISSLYIVSIGLGFILLFFLGAFLGTVSKESMVLSGLKMLIAGAVCALVLFLVGKI